MKRKRQFRPIRVQYYHLGDPVDRPAAYGHCASEVGVLRGAMVRLFLRQYDIARVYKDGINIMTVTMKPDGLPQVRFGPHILGEVLLNGTIKYKEHAA